MANRDIKEEELTDSTEWPSDWSVGVRVSIERLGQTIVDDAAAQMLLAVERTNSISAAARSLGISYRHAWLLLNQASSQAGQPLVQTAIGGQRGGGAQLTEQGRAALAVFHKLQAHVRATAATALPKIVASMSHETSVVHLAAAISLQEVIALLLNEYALVRPTISVRTVFGASNELAEQIISGSPIDVFISANCDQIDRLARSGIIDLESRRQVATNGLAIAGNHAENRKLRRAADLLKIPDLALVVADPACPLGKCTEDFLKHERLLDDLRPRMRFVENSRAVVAAIRATVPRVGIIFGSDIANAHGAQALLEIPTSRIKSVYEGAAISGSTALVEAKALLEFFTSKQAQGAFRACGFSAR